MIIDLQTKIPVNEQEAENATVEMVVPELNERQTKIREAIQGLHGYRGEVYSKSNVRNLPGVQVGEIFWVEAEGRPYVVAEKKGKKVTIRPLDENATVSTGITIYDMNKSICAQEPLFDWKDTAASMKLFADMVNWMCATQNRLYLLYGRDIHYLTVFEYSGDLTSEGMVELSTTVGSVGDLISMDFNGGEDEEYKVEIWVRTNTSDAELLYLFPYDKGLVKI